jgi:hypothetical protein
MTETRHLRLPILLVACAALAACGSSTEPAAAPSSTSLQPTRPPTTSATTSNDPSPDGVPLPNATVDASSVHVSQSGAWVAQGLIHNGGSADEGGMVLTATLLGADGSELETVSADVAVHPVYAGETVPFSISSQTDAAAVGDVRWSVSAGSQPPASREFDFATYWQRATTDDRTVDMYLYRDAPGAPHPYLLFGSVMNTGSAPVTGVDVIVAWLDGNGQVAAVESAPAQLGDRESLAPDAAADWLFVVDGPEGQAIDGLETRFWGVGT